MKTPRYILLGTFIVHRLINKRDKQAIENAVSSANKNALSFLPILGEGEALLVGVDFPIIQFYMEFSYHKNRYATLQTLE